MWHSIFVTKILLTHRKVCYFEIQWNRMLHLLILMQAVQFWGRFGWSVASSIGQYREKAWRTFRYGVSFARLFKRVHNNAQAICREYDKSVRSLSFNGLVVCSRIKKPYELQLQLDCTTESMLYQTNRHSLTTRCAFFSMHSSQCSTILFNFANFFCSWHFLMI